MTINSIGPVDHPDNLDRGRYLRKERREHIRQQPSCTGLFLPLLEEIAWVQGIANISPRRKPQLV
jgi:hypothetical protein